MKVWVLAENTGCRGDLVAEHGLSLYIETAEHKILFDMGQSGAFADNARVMGIDLSQVDIAVISHGHYDHGGGLERFLSLNQKAPIYLSSHAFEPHYNAKGKYIGLDPALEKHPRLRFVEDTLAVAPGAVLHSCEHWRKSYPMDPCGMTAGRGRQVEDFRHEIYLLLREEGKRVCISGCSHKGICNIAAWFRPDVLIGGAHLKGIDPEGDGAKTLQSVAKQLLRFPTRYYTGHCTGTAQFALLKQQMGERVFYLSTGAGIEV